LDPDYPKNLTSIYDPPPVLYVFGTLVPEDEMAVAIVGSRRPSVYGIKMAARFAAELAERGITIVSGLARGIDGEAHRACLRAKGRTIAVLGSGLDIIYPKEHAELFSEIGANGAVISEFPIGTIPQAFNFPRRNRVISGLSRGILVVEASQKSGSLITASSAAEEGREVYAIPGPIDSMTSSGTNHLIQNGAKLVMHSEEILEDLLPQIRASLESCQKNQSVIPAKAGIQKSLDLRVRGDDTSRQIADDPILKLLAKQPLSFDELAIALSREPAQVQSHLIKLELEGAVRRIFGGQYVRS
jgi:DNA processing protein